MQSMPENSISTVEVFAWDPGTGDTPDTSSASWIPEVNVEDSDFPVENLLDDHPKNLSKTTQTNVVYEFSGLAATDAIAMFNCDASRVIIKVYYTTGTVEIPGTGGDYSMSGIITYQQLISDDASYKTALLHTYDYQVSPHTVRVFIMAKNSDNVSCGVVRIDSLITVEDPVYPVTQSFKDYSIVAELNSGATYTLQRPIVRKFNFELDVSLCRGTPLVLMRLFKDIGPSPIPWLIHDEGAQALWLVFARKDAEPAGNFYAFNRTKIPIALIEVL
jgi:hypothetical protein